MSPGLAKAIAEGTLKFPEGQPEPTFFHCAVDDCGYKSYGEIAQKYHAKEVHDLAKPKFVGKVLNEAIQAPDYNHCRFVDQTCLHTEK